MQGAEIGQTFFAAGDELAVDDKRGDGERGQCDGDIDKARREVVPGLAVDADAVAHLVQLHAIAIELHFVQPAIAARSADRNAGSAGGMKRMRGRGVGKRGTRQEPAEKVVRCW